MHTLRHPCDTELLLAIDGELERRRRTLVDAHVSTCDVCRARIQEIQSTLADASRVYRSEFDASLPPPRYARVRLERALHEAGDAWNQSWVARFRVGLALWTHSSAALGVVVALVVLAVVSMSRSDEGLRSPRRNLESALPVAAFTPGAVSDLGTAELCEGARPSRVVTEDSRRQVLRAYGMEHAPGRVYELDALITPELGGTTDPANLWPQRYDTRVWNARVKDQLERLLPRLVCSQQVALAQAQRDIATDWIAAYRRYFRTDVPLDVPGDQALADDDELEFAPVQYVTAKLSPFVLDARFMRR